MNGDQTVSIDKVWWVVVVFSSLFINIGVMLYFLYAKLDEVEALLHDVQFICWYRSVFGTSLIGRQARMNAIAMIVMLPDLMQRRGEVSREAYLRLPDSIIQQIRALYVVMFANCLAMIGLYFFIY